MNRLLATLLCLNILWFVGCHAAVVSKAELTDLHLQYGGQTLPPTWYYCGSDDRYDHFAMLYSMTIFTSDSSRCYRVPREQHAVTMRFGLTRNRTEWRELNFHDFYDLPDPNRIDFWEPVPLDELPKVPDADS